jgi:CheY-like chemotaxis protein
MNKPTDSGAAPANQGGGEIYVVDDEPLLLELASVILEPLGYSLKTFRSAEAAISEFKAANPHPLLIITDYAMAGMNGMELIKECRRLRPDQKILLVSGTVGPDVYRDTPVRPDRYLGKPYQANQLMEMVKSILSA